MPNPIPTASSAVETAAPYLSLVIPAYNEERRLGPTLGQVLAYLLDRPYTAEVIVVSDGSNDRTAQVAREALSPYLLDAPPSSSPAGGPRHVVARVLEYHPNAGKGRAVRTGVLATAGRFVAFTDADLSTPIEELDRALQFLDGASPAGAKSASTTSNAKAQPQYRLVIGSRAVEGAAIERYQPLYRRLSARFFNVLRDTIVGLRDLRDTQCGLKVFDGPMARFIFGRQRIDGFMFDVETMYIAQRLGVPVLEMGVRWADAPESKVRLTSGLRLLPDLLRIRLLHQGLSGADLSAVLRPAVAAR